MNKKLRLEILEKMTTLITAGFGLVAALAWNDAIKELFKTIFGKQSGLVAMFVYALVVTVIVVVITVKLGQAINKIKEEVERNEDKK